jgi:ribosomal protein L37AE/L43A
MSGPRVAESKRCPDCGAVLPLRDPLVGWWLCDDCELAVDGDGNRITEQ